MCIIGGGLGILRGMNYVGVGEVGLGYVGGY